MDRIQTLQLVVTAIGVLLVPIVLYYMRSTSAQRAEEYRLLVVRLERMENGVGERITRLEEKIDAHIAWHLKERP
jgi:hypothetical protein